MYKSTVTLVLLSIVVALVNAQCSCQTKPPLDIKYQGEACECGRQYPVQMEVPKITEHRDAHYDYGFTIERPQQAPAEVKYTFDFHMEKPKPPPTATLATYGFEVQTPVQKEAEVPQRYSFDYQLQRPIVKSDPNTLQGLVTLVDRVVLPKPDCNEKSGCQCSSYKPTIDTLQRCPKHGHLYQYGGALYPNPQRYNQVSRSLQQQQPIPAQVLTSSDRPKRNVPSAFPIKFQQILPGLRPNNQITKVTPAEDETEKRIAEILKANFGEDPRENIEELLRPKPLGKAKKIESDVAEAKAMDVPASPDFILKMKPKLEEARSNFRSQITKIVNKARLDAIRAKHLIQKRSTEPKISESEFSDDMSLDEDESFDGSYEPIWITEESVEQQTEDPINDRENGNAVGESTNDRFRKHCDRCGELAQKFPCPSCGAAPSNVPEPQNFEMKQGHPSRYVQDHPKQTPQHLAQPRYESRQGDDVTVGSYHHQHQPNGYGQLQDILNKNSGAMYSQNRRLGDGHLVQPMDFEHASDAIRFIQELTQRNNNQYNDDYYSNGNSYNVGASPQNYHAKRSFEIIPLAEKDDGSVFVKISPIRSSKLNNEPKVNENSNKRPQENNPESGEQYYNETKSASSLHGNNFSEQKPKANVKKFVRGGKNYEILALSANGSNEGSVGSEEDLEILKYVYAVNQKGNSPAKKIQNNKPSKTDDEVET